MSDLLCRSSGAPATTSCSSRTFCRGTRSGTPARSIPRLRRRPAARSSRRQLPPGLRCLVAALTDPDNLARGRHPHTPGVVEPRFRPPPLGEGDDRRTPMTGRACERGRAAPGDRPARSGTAARNSTGHHPHVRGEDAELGAGAVRAARTGIDDVAVAVAAAAPPAATPRLSSARTHVRRIAIVTSNTTLPWTTSRNRGCRSRPR